MFCPGCGNAVDDGQRFCTSCGADIKKLLQQSSGSQQAEPSVQTTQAIQPEQPVQAVSPSPDVSASAAPVTSATVSAVPPASAVSAPVAPAAPAPVPTVSPAPPVQYGQLPQNQNMQPPVPQQQYGAPQPQYGQPPVQQYPSPDGPGQYPPVQPKKKTKTGCIIAVIVALVILVGLAVVIIIPAVLFVMDPAYYPIAPSEAASVDNACKCYYAGIVSGAINEDYEYDIDFVDDLPPTGASISERKEAAKKCTVEGAIKYGIKYWDLSEDIFDRLSDYGADKEGNIWDLHAERMNMDDIVINGLKKTTTLGELYFQDNDDGSDVSKDESPDESDVSPDFYDGSGYDADPSDVSSDEPSDDTASREPSGEMSGYYDDGRLFYEYTVYFIRPSGWGQTVYAYIYNDNNSNGVWPGEVMDIESDGKYSYSIDVEDGVEAYIVFTDGTNQYPKSRGFELVNNKVYGQEAAT